MSRRLQPPPALRRPGVRFDNVALVPANLLPFKAQYQALANRLPRGAVLVVLPSPTSSTHQLLKQAAHELTARGHHAATVTVDALCGRL